jgi:Uma2 family endonuclease
MLETAAPLTDYEIERGKPMPSFNHSILQTQISFLLKRDYGKEFTFPSELDLAFVPKGAVPDICVYPKMKRDYKHEEDIVKMTQPPITAIEIVSPGQILEDVVSKARKIYFPNDVKSVWVVMPSLETIVIIDPNLDTTFFNKGELFDPANNIRLSIEEVFE